MLQQVFSTINSTLEIDDILSMVLRGIRGSAAFRPGSSSSTSRTPSSARRLETDSDGMVHPVHRTPTRSSPGRCSIKWSPERASYSWFGRPRGVAGRRHRTAACMLPLISRDTVRGILYVDDPARAPRSATRRCGCCSNFAAQAAITIQKRASTMKPAGCWNAERLALTDALTGIAQPARPQRPAGQASSRPTPSATSSPSHSPSSTSTTSSGSTTRAATPPATGR